MKVMKRFCCTLIVLLFFFAGVCIADKQFFAQHVTGISILAQQDDARVQAMYDYIAQLQYEDAQDLCGQIAASDFSVQSGCIRQYFDTCYFENGVIPAGVYDTVRICLTEESNGGIQHNTLTGDRFVVPNKPVTLVLQNGYISVLTLIGKLDQLLLKEQ